MTPREAWFFVTGLLMRDDDPAEYWRGFLDGQAEASEPMRPDDQFFLAGETWTGAERERARRRTADEARTRRPGDYRPLPPVTDWGPDGQWRRVRETGPYGDQYCYRRA